MCACPQMCSLNGPNIYKTFTLSTHLWKHREYMMDREPTLPLYYYYCFLFYAWILVFERFSIMCAIHQVVRFQTDCPFLRAMQSGLLKRWETPLYSDFLTVCLQAQRYKKLETSDNMENSGLNVSHFGNFNPAYGNIKLKYRFSYDQRS